MQTELYRYFDESGNLLYVGISTNSVKRMKEHRCAARWYEKASRIEIERFPTRERALDAERRAIVNERPIHNVVHAQPEPPEALTEPERQPRQEPSVPSTFMDTVEAARYLGLKKTTLEAWRSRGGGPQFVKLGRSVRYRRPDLDDWICGRVFANTIESGAAA